MKSFWDKPDLIMGGDLNFSMGEAEIWGTSVRMDELSDFFRHRLSQVGVTNVPPTKMTPTWRNRRMGEDFVAKRLDRFLITDPLLELVDRIRQWVGGLGDLDHNLIILEIAHGGEKPLIPFKFNGDWLKQPDFINLIKDLWIPFDLTVHTITTIHFVDNLNRANKQQKSGLTIRK